MNDSSIQLLHRDKIIGWEMVGGIASHKSTALFYGELFFCFRRDECMSADLRNEFFEVHRDAQMPISEKGTN